MAKTYGFGDVSMVIAHPSYGQYVANGAGLGSITTTMTTDRTAHDVAADGTVMVSKVKGRNGSQTLSIQQTSGLNQWLMGLYNYVEAADASQWAEISTVIRSPNMGDLITCTGVSFKILPEKPFEAEGQKISWAFMAADVDQNVL